MASTSPGYGITIRVDGPASAQPVSEITQAILAAGASITALDVVESVLDRVVIDVTCDAIDAEHAEAITAALSENKNLNVRKVSDRTFLLHLGGKIEITSKVPLKTRDDLSRAYTPGEQFSTNHLRIGSSSPLSSKINPSLPKPIIFLAPFAISNLATAVPAAPTPLNTILVDFKSFFTSFNAFVSAANTTIAVPC